MRIDKIYAERLRVAEDHLAWVESEDFLGLFERAADGGREIDQSDDYRRCARRTVEAYQRALEILCFTSSPWDHSET